MTARSNRGLVIAGGAIVVVCGLIAIGMWRFSLAGDDSAAAIQLAHAEADDQESSLASSEWTFTPESPVPRTKPSPDELRPDYVVRFGIDRWPGWAPLVYANGGFKPGKTWTAIGPRLRKFQLEVVVIDSPAQMRAAFAAGTIQIGAATVDMLPFMLDELPQVAQTPRVEQQLDWSNGGDAIVARKDIAKLADLTHKTVVVVEHSPAHFLLLAALFDAGVDVKQIELRFTKTTGEAIQAFNHDRSIAACAVRAPAIDALVNRDDNKLLATTKTMNTLIADVWFARADFAAKSPGLMKSIGKGILDGMAALDDAAVRRQVAGWMAEPLSVSPDDVLRAFDALHWTSYAENRAFLLAADDPANFQRTYDVAATVSRSARHVIPFDRICDFTIVRGLAEREAKGPQAHAYQRSHQPWSLTRIQTDAGEILARRLTIHFAPNSYALDAAEAAGTLDEARRILVEYGASARVVIEGHSDSSYRGWVDEQQQIALSTARADAVKKAVVEKVSSLRADQIVTKGLGISQPASASDPGNHARNRRVEITLYRAQ